MKPYTSTSLRDMCLTFISSLLSSSANSMLSKNGMIDVSDAWLLTTLTRAVNVAVCCTTWKWNNNTQSTLQNALRCGFSLRIGTTTKPFVLLDRCVYCWYLCLCFVSTSWCVGWMCCDAYGSGMREWNEQLQLTHENVNGAQNTTHVLYRVIRLKSNFSPFS